MSDITTDDGRGTPWYGRAVVRDVSRRVQDAGVRLTTGSVRVIAWLPDGTCRVCERGTDDDPSAAMRLRDMLDRLAPLD